VEKWGGIVFILFSANLFIKRLTKFRQYSLSLVGDITKAFWYLFSWTQCIMAFGVA